jgi:hypothetical protein
MSISVLWNWLVRTAYRDVAHFRVQCRVYKTAALSLLVLLPDWCLFLVQFAPCRFTQSFQMPHLSLYLLTFRLYLSVTWSEPDSEGRAFGFSNAEISQVQIPFGARLFIPALLSVVQWWWSDPPSKGSEESYRLLEWPIPSCCVLRIKSGDSF